MYEDTRDRTCSEPCLLSDLAPQPTTATVGAQPSKSITLVVAGRLFRDCLEHVLKKIDRFDIKACETLAEVGVPGAQAPDLMICHVEAADNNVDIFHRIRRLQMQFPSLRCLILRREANLGFVRDAIENGVQGILLEDSPEDILRLAVDTILLGYSFVPVELAQLLRPPAPPSTHLPGMALQKTWTNPRRQEDKTPDSEQMRVDRTTFPFRHWHLSSRETQILRCLEQGQSNKLIARELDIAEATVKVHVQALLRKMQVTNRTQAAMAARNFLGAASGPARTNMIGGPLNILTSVGPKAMQENTARVTHHGPFHASDAP
jgi:two-component system nitrate/nitrite response regulator NarL